MVKPKDHITSYCPVLRTTKANHLSAPENLVLQRARLGLSTSISPKQFQYNPNAQIIWSAGQKKNKPNISS